MKLFTPSLIHAFIWLVAFILAVNDKDNAASIFMIASVCFGVLAQIWVWNSKQLIWIGIGLGFLKFSIAFYMSWNCWDHFIYSGKADPQAQLAYFWYMSPFLFVFGIIESAIVYSHVRKSITALK